MGLLRLRKFDWLRKWRVERVYKGLESLGHEDLLVGLEKLGCLDSSA